MVGFTKTGRERMIVLAKLGKHVAGFDELRIVVLYALQSRYVTDGSDAEAAQLSSTKKNLRMSSAC
jgi:hypothetical protein